MDHGWNQYIGRARFACVYVGDVAIGIEHKYFIGLSVMTCNM